jgi:hypothetical protein
MKPPEGAGILSHLSGSKGGGDAIAALIPIDEETYREFRTFLAKRRKMPAEG